MGYNRKGEDWWYIISKRPSCCSWIRRIPDRKKDSPIWSKQSLKMLFTVASIVNWGIESIDIKAAFLQGDELEWDVFIHLPKEISEPGKIWKLKCCIYGLYELINKLGGQISKFHKTYFLWHHEDVTISGLYVEHFIYCGANEWLLNVVEPIIKFFKINASGIWDWMWYKQMMWSMLTKMPVLRSWSMSTWNQTEPHKKMKFWVKKKLNQWEPLLDSSHGWIYVHI